jgi:Tfp pilus assembly protein PilF/peroxiredoxin
VTSSILRVTVCALCLAVLGRVIPADTSAAARSLPRAYVYHPKFRVPPSLESVLRHLVAGEDAFPEERDAEEIAERLAELSKALRQWTSSGPSGVGGLLAPDFRGGRLRPRSEVSRDSGPQLEIVRGTVMSPDATLDRTSFQSELTRFLGGFQGIRTAEFLITAISVEPGASPRARTTVRFDLVGTSERGHAERLGRWQMWWRREADRTWRITEWTALEDLRSRAPAPVFTEVTDLAFGHNGSFRQQLLHGLDYWASRLDGVFTPRGMGHHGVSVGDIDGDGFDDVYASQPDGLPNRLFRNTGDGTFQDVTEASGLAVLDRTSQSLFADVDNDGDQDLVLLTRIGPMMFLNDGSGKYARDTEAFHFAHPLKGSLTSAAMADYDRDGFLDLYLCAYGYFIGVSEDKAGPPNPYHEAQNGSPNVLLRNDGHGRFLEVTEELGLNHNNDRFSFAAAFADYDADGWPDLLVANDFGRKNLYRSTAAIGGARRFEDVAAATGVEDYGAGMSATFLDYDNDGHLDIYTGNMWTSAGQRVTGEPGFKPDAAPEIRDVYRRHARGNSLFRNRGDGTFEDVTLQAGAEFGRWAWSSDAFDFDSDGWEDLYIVNGMFTRDDNEPAVDVDSFFWRQVVAQSPLARTPGTTYDDGWRATNRLLVSNGAQAQHERNVLLRNNGQGGFDDISGTSGLDIDQDGRAFSVLDYDSDGDSDVLLMAPRSSPQLRLFRNDFSAGHSAVAIRLTGTKSNRDAVGARVTVEADRVRATRVLKAGSGFISQHSKELLFGLGSSRAVAKVTIAWPSGLVQTVPAVPVNHRIWVREGSDEVRTEALPRRAAAPSAPGGPPMTDSSNRTATGTWLYEPYPAPDFTLSDLDGQERSLSGLANRTALLLFWASWAPPSREALTELVTHRDALAKAGIPALALSVDSSEDVAKVREAGRGAGVPVLIAGDAVAGTYTVLHRYLFDRREDLPLPIAFLVSPKGEIVKVYRDRIAAAQILEDAQRTDVSVSERLKRAVPFAGTFYSNLGERSYFQYGLELSEQGFDQPALAAFERVAAQDPSAITFHNLATLYMKGGRSADARAAFERALTLKPDYADASNSLGALLAQSGEVPAAIERFRAALQAKPDFPDAINNLGFALFQTGDAARARELYEKALALQPGFPEALNNLGIFYGMQRDLDRAMTYFQQAVNGRPGYGEAANNLALVLAARGETGKAIDVLQRLLQVNPAFETAYVTLCRIYLKGGQRQEGTQVLERLLQRNPTHPVGLQLLQGIRTGG